MIGGARPTTEVTGDAREPCSTRFSRTDWPGSDPLLTVRDLEVQFVTRKQHVFPVRGISFELPRGGTLAIVGASGSGKSVSCRALSALLPEAAIVSGSVRLGGKELLGLSEGAMRRHRGADIAMVFQDADRALNPTMQVGAQISEAVRAHGQVGRRFARDRALDLLHLLRFRAPRIEYELYPHQLSGGMRQRALIAMAIALRPSVLIADEPTRSLDATTQAAIMELLMDVQGQLHMALILISHDLRMVASFADAVLVMCAGKVIEYGPKHRVVAHPSAPYTRALLDAIPPLASARPCEVSPANHDLAVVSGTELRDRPVLLRARNLVQDFRSPTGMVRALSNVSFEIRTGETLGVVGETGSGKSSLARALLQAPTPTSGSVSFRDRDLTKLRGSQLVEHRRHIQMVFQDPFGSLDPKWHVFDIVEEPLIAQQCGHSSQRRRKVRELLDLVGLTPDLYGSRRPRQLSGGECQRVAIARALALEPLLIICDEAVSSLDVIVQKQILELFRRLRAELKLAYLFISHDLVLVQNFSDRVAVMYVGHLCEIGPTAEIYHQPRHPYTAELLSSLCLFDAPRPPVKLSASVRDNHQSTDGCRFLAHCSRAKPRCAAESPELRPIHADHSVACHYPLPSGATVVSASTFSGT